MTTPAGISQSKAIVQRQQLKAVLKKARILLVDDMEFNLTFICNILREQGFHNIICAKNGREALEKTYEWHPDIAVVDLIMPEMDGMEFCRKIREDAELHDMPIIMQTAITTPEQRAKAFESGATDFINKPIDSDEMTARILVHLERHKLLKDLMISRRRIEHELNDARQMQEVILPSKEHIETVQKHYKCTLIPYSVTSSELGGDFWGVKMLSKHQMAIYITDFSGHGVTAALNTFRLHTLMEEYSYFAKNPGHYLTELNNRLTQLLTVGQFATMFYGVIDVRKNVLFYATAASPSPFLISQRKGSSVVIDGTGFPLGVSKGVTYETKKCDFFPKDMLCLYSDALIETENEQGHFFDEEALYQFMCEHYQWASKSDYVDIHGIAGALIRKFECEYRPNLRDDLTINFYLRH